MVAAKNPLVRKLRARNFGDHVVQRLDVPVGKHFQTNFSGTGPKSVSDGKASAPCRGHHRACDCSKKRLGVGVGNRKDGNFRQRGSILDGEALGVGGCADSRSQRIAHEFGAVLHAAALHSLFRTPGTLGVGDARGIAIVTRVRINNATDSAMLGSDHRLDAAPGVAVPRDDDCAFYRDAVAFENFVVIRDAVIHVNERAGDVAVSGIRVVGWKLLGLLIGCGILGHRRFL